MKTLFLKLFIIISLFFPAFYSAFSEEYKMEYYAVFAVAYGAAFFFILFQLFEGKREKGQKLLAGCAGVLLLYNLFSFYMNVRYLHWYGDQINYTLAFLFFLCLCWHRDSLGEKGDDLVRFFLCCAVVSNLLSIVYFLMGYTSLVICNNHVYLSRLPEDYYEYRFYWIYSHKSTYALMLVAFMAVCIRFRKLFRSRPVWLCSMAVFLIDLFLTHSWTGFGAAGLLFAGACLDEIDWGRFRWKGRYFLWAVPVAAAGGIAGKILLGERDLLSLGGRLEIWRGALRTIAENPRGWGLKFTEVLFQVHPGWDTNNAHNVFFFSILRDSIPVGVCFTLLFLLIAVYSLRKSRSFLGAGLWLAFFLLLNMDYAMLNYEAGILLFVVYLVCVYPYGERRRKHGEAEETAA